MAARGHAGRAVKLDAGPEDEPRSGRERIDEERGRSEPVAELRTVRLRRAYDVAHIRQRISGVRLQQPLIRGVRCCNRAATGAERIRTEQENYGARNGKNCLYKRDLPTGQYPPGKH